MRLTLRTMLACLDADDRLDPADVEDLSQKIQHSKYATDLAARIRQLVQHPRVGTPRLDAKGNGLDANSVSEYLDNTLAPEKIADFERNCIESDVRLTEVAACHQILVLVLEQPAEIEPHTRERMYRLGAESKRVVPEGTAIVAHETRSVPSGGSVRIDRPATESVAPATPKPLPEVPEYLRAGRRRQPLWPLALAALLAIAAIGVGLRLMGPFDSSHPIAKIVQQEMSPPPTGDAEATGDDSQTPPTIAKPKPPEETTVVPTPGDQGSSKEDSQPGKVEEGAYQGLPSAPKPPDEGEVGTTKKPPLTPPLPETNTEVATTETEMTETTEKPLPVPPPVEPLDPDAVEPPQPAAADVARFISEDQLLVRYTAEDKFVRVPTRASLVAGDELLALPAYRPQLLLTNNIQLTIAPESRLRLAMNAGETADVRVAQGRLLAIPVGKANAKIALQLGSLRGIATLANAETELAIEVRHYLPPGSDPQVEDNIVPVVRLYTTRGKVTWEEEGAETPDATYEIAAGNVRNYVGSAPGETVSMTTLPDWIDGRSIADIDRRAAREVEAKLAETPDLELTLQELASASERRAEVRSLAIRSLIMLDQYEPFLAAIADETQRAYWAAEYDVMRDALVRNTETAHYIYEVFIKTRGEQDGNNLYRMLWGFSPEQLQAGMAKELVDSLDVELLDYRVLAFETLRRITGSTQLYQPQFPATRRRTPVTQWRERLKAGEIVYKTPPAPIMDPKPLSGGPPARPAEPRLDP